MVVIYEDLPTRERAMIACDQLVNQFWPEIEFKFHWWRTDFLEDDDMAEVAAQNACEAHFLVFCGGVEKHLTPKARRWFEGWVSSRKNQDVALLDLTDPEAGLNWRLLEKRTYLRDLARRSRAEYLTNAPTALPDKSVTVQNTALPTADIASVLDQILRQAPMRPAHWARL